MLVTVKCITDGARIAGRPMFMNQIMSADLDAAQVAALRVAICAGDMLAIEGLDEPAPVKASIKP